MELKLTEAPSSATGDTNLLIVPYGIETSLMCDDMARFTNF